MTLVWQKSVNHIWQNLKIRKYFNRWAAQNAASLNKNWRKAAPHLLNSRKCNWVGGDYSRVGSNLVPKATNGTQSRLKSKIGVVFLGRKNVHIPIFAKSISLKLIYNVLIYFALVLCETHVNAWWMLNSKPEFAHKSKTELFQLMQDDSLTSLQSNT